MYKTLLPLFGVIVLVFGITVLASNTPSDPGTTIAGDGASDADPTAVGTLLRIPQTEARYDPNSENAYNRFITNMYETGPDEHPTSFWFQNVHPFPVRVSVLARSCTSCTSARIAVLPQDAANELFRTNVLAEPSAAHAVGLFPGLVPAGALPVPDLTGVIAAAGLTKAIQWKEFDFDRHDEFADIPPGSPDRPTWGVFQFGIKVSSLGPVSRSVRVGLQAGKASYQEVNFTVYLSGVKPFMATPETVTVGEVQEDGSPIGKEFIYWSSTREANELPKPELSIPPNDPLIALGEPVRMTPTELEDFSRERSRTSTEGLAFVVRSGWRVPVTVLPKLPADGPGRDIGPFEKVIGVIGPGPDPGRVTVKGTITGLVSLKDGSNLKFGTIEGRTDTTRPVTLTSPKIDLDIEPVPDEFRPVSLKVEVGPASTNGARREWSMRVTIPANSGLGDLPADSAVVLRTKEPKPRLIRIPIQGTILRR